MVQESASWRVASQPSQVFFLSSLNILFLIVSSFLKKKKVILILKHALMKKPDLTKLEKVDHLTVK